MSKRLIKVAKELNVATSTIVEFLTGKGFAIENKPIAQVSGEMESAVRQEFAKAISDKEKASKMEFGTRPSAPPPPPPPPVVRSAPPPPPPRPVSVPAPPPVQAPQPAAKAVPPTPAAPAAPPRPTPPAAAPAPAPKAPAAQTPAPPQGTRRPGSAQARSARPQGYGPDRSGCQ